MRAGELFEQNTESRETISVKIWRAGEIFQQNAEDLELFQHNTESRRSI